MSAKRSAIRDANEERKSQASKKTSSKKGGMSKMRNKIEQLKKKGQGLVEYALILVLIAIVVILILTFLGQKVNDTFSTIGSGLGT
jgi:pilus assembly protein Flp/PilA